MTEEQKKRLTEFIGECWHDVTDTYPLDPPGSKHCDTCEEYVTSKKLHNNRTFLTWDDLGACMEALVKKGKWEGFYEFSIVEFRKTHYYKLWRSEQAVWLFRPVNEAGEPHFCALVCSFLEDKHD